MALFSLCLYFLFSLHFHFFLSHFSYIFPLFLFFFSLSLFLSLYALILSLSLSLSLSLCFINYFSPFSVCLSSIFLIYTKFFLQLPIDKWKWNFSINPLSVKSEFKIRTSPWTRTPLTCAYGWVITMYARSSSFLCFLLFSFLFFTNFSFLFLLFISVKLRVPSLCFFKIFP